MRGLEVITNTQTCASFLISLHIFLSFLHYKPHIISYLALSFIMAPLAQAAKICYNNRRVGVTCDMGAKQA